jgi:hypothetical protein
MADKCWSSVRSCAARVTKVDGCGVPVAAATADAFAVTKGYISINYAMNISEGEEIEVKNACGELCISDKADDSLKWIDVEAAFCQVDPGFISIMSGYTVVEDADANAVGFRVKRNPSTTGYALETWTTIPSALCEPGATAQYGYFLLPWVRGGQIQDLVLENGAATFTFKGRSLYGSGWGVGPWDVVDSGVGVPVTPGPLLDPIAEDEAFHIQLTTIAPPTPVCGAQAMPA